MGCHLGWHFAIGCPLKGGREKYKQQGLLFHQKQLRKKKCVEYCHDILSHFVAVVSTSPLPVLKDYS
jgi:hypothetical protein